MPTGYTEAVQSGELTDFNAFAWQCARNFGALIIMRDASVNAPIPERFEPEVAYYDLRIADAMARLSTLREMSPLAVREAAQQAYADNVRAEADYADKNNAHRKRYQAMLAKVQDWEPPTEDHVGLKAFMVEQLESSIRFDCSGGYWQPAVKMEPDTWLAAQIEGAEREIEHQTAERAKEVERTEGRNRWLSALRQSLAPA